MGRLKTIASPIKKMAPRLGYASGDEKARDKQRRDTQPWRSWYKTARWQRLREKVFTRDLYTCQRSGEICAGRGNQPNAPVANHKIPHNGDPVLFWDESNIETVTKRVHDSLIQSEEKRTGLR
ncbi:HNH endonuclease [Nitratireductor basaltis]|uniref:HNH endonuclease n=1 Tax=Nitratireductor basaltis TaxID=472175 RepID=A0A084UBL1_9HYPH|nr:HNH endonuclease [Nitratireductor basaltis]KFB10347.1 HNH endonuclease [Nitratireductor basaltis]